MSQPESSDKAGQADEAEFELWWQVWRAANGWPNTEQLRATARPVYEQIKGLKAMGQAVANTIRTGHSAPSAELHRVTEEMVETAAQRMVALVMSGIIEKPQLVQWQQWAGSARAILEAALGSESARSASRDRS